MAYFNYYIFKKIIREIINSLFRFIKKHKKIILFLLIWFLYLFFNNNVFAVEELPDTSEFENYILTKDIESNGTIKYYAWVPNSSVYGDLYYLFNVSGGRRFDYKTSSSDTGYGGSFTYYLYNSSSGTWSRTGTIDYVIYYASWNIERILISSSYDIFDVNNNEYFYETPKVTYVQPSFISTISDLENVENEYLKINQGSFEDSIYLRLYNNTSNTLIFNTKLTNYEDYIEREDLDNPFSELIYNIPYSAFPSFQLTYNNDYEFRLVYYNEDDVLSNVSIFFTPTTTEDVNDVTNKDLNDSIKDTNEKLDSIEDTLTDSNVDVDVETDLPSVDVQDPTQNGIDNIFNSIYNAFCTGEAQNIVLPIPYTEKNISISPYYVRDMLNNNGAGWLYIFIQAFWAYIFGRFIIKDISNKINKIKSGDIDNIQNSNIKEEML